MTNITTTLAAIRAASPCREGWAKLKKHVGNLADDAPLAVAVVLESNGLDDSLWVLAHACGDRREIAVRFARECVLRACEHAERVLPVLEAARPDDTRPRRAIEAARKNVAYAANVAAYDADADAARAATYAADVAAYAAAHEREREWQRTRLREMLEGER